MCILLLSFFENDNNYKIINKILIISIYRCFVNNFSISHRFVSYNFTFTALLPTFTM